MPAYLYYALAFLWLYSATVPILFNQTDSLALLAKMGLSPHLSWVLLIAASLLDLIFAFLSLFYNNASRLWLAQFITVVLYSVLIILFLPQTLLHPFAPVLKNLPILALLWYLYRYHQHPNPHNP